MHYRIRAERALGRKLQRGEHVHHHSATQLVICDAAYHGWLHRQMRRLGMLTDKPLNYILRGMDDDLWKRVKAKAALQETSIKELIDSLLRGWLKEK